MSGDSRLKHFQRLAQALGRGPQGSRDALGRMLESCRTYLMLVASEELEAICGRSWGQAMSCRKHSSQRSARLHGSMETRWKNCWLGCAKFC